jgi:metal-dependent amidase/aminoacylase/carboxypeptidase family protein
MHAWRRDIHAHPELMYDTHRTSTALVARKAARLWL